MKQEIVDRLNAFLQRNPELRGQPASLEQIRNAEAELGVTLGADYREFIQTFGGAYAGLCIHAFSNGSAMGRETVVDLTRMGRRLLNHMGLFPEINSCYVISDDGSGNPIALCPNGEVWLFDHDTELKTRLAASLAQLIEEHFEEW
jgi:hypothetical protein